MDNIKQVYQAKLIDIAKKLSEGGYSSEDCLELLLNLAISNAQELLEINLKMDRILSGEPYLE